MSFLKNLISNGIRDGVRKGVRDAVSGAIGNAIKPVADNIANKTAEGLNSAAATVEAEAKDANGAFAELKKATENYAAAMEEAAKAAGYTGKGVVPDGECPFDEFYVYVPEVFPEWICGGAYHELRMAGCNDANGREIAVMTCEGDRSNLDKYLMLIRAAGFTQNGSLWEKTADGVTYCLDTTDALVGDAISISFYTK